MMGECYMCENWKTDHWITDRYGEGFGWCEVEAQARFCNHKCPFTTMKEECCGHESDEST